MRGRAFRNPLFVALILLGLGFARLGNWALFRVFLPTLLAFLSIFFGPGLGRAARRCSEVGLMGERGLAFASDMIRHRFMGIEPPAPPKIRVEEQERGQIRVEEVPDEEAEPDDTAERELRRSQRGR